MARHLIAFVGCLSIASLLACQEGREIARNDGGGSDADGSTSIGSGGAGGKAGSVGSVGGGGTGGNTGSDGGDAGDGKDGNGGDIRDGSNDPNLDTPTSCALGFKPCLGTCIPAGDCCTRGDCAGACTDCSNGTCAPVINHDDSDLSRCAGTCDATGGCRSRKGQLCNAVPGNCVSGTFCSPDGTCCDRACDGSCEACDIQGYQGICTPVAMGGTPHTSHAACLGAGTPCAGYCAGLANGLCQYPTVACGSAACLTSSSSRGLGSCGAGSCASPASRSCGPYNCSPTTGLCANTCATVNDCVPGYACVGGSCVLCGGPFQPCCMGTTCNSALICAGGDAGAAAYCQACGAAGQPCCAGNSCSSDASCNTSTRLCVVATPDAAPG